MEKFIPYEKLSKKKRREVDSARRGTWGALSPVTRKPENSRAYNRKKAHQWKREPPSDVLFCGESQHFTLSPPGKFLRIS